jgi:chemotaxis protein histidine kinase CheA
VVDAEIMDTAATVIEGATPGLSEIEIPGAPQSVVALPTRPDASAVAEAVPVLTPAASVAPASVETPATPTPQLENELAELKSELSELKTGMKSDLEAGLSELKSQMKTEMSQLKSELKSDLSELKTGMKSDFEVELSELKSKIESQPMPEAKPAVPGQPARPAEDNIFEKEKGGKSSYEDFQETKREMTEEAKPAPQAAADDAPASPAAKPVDPDSPLPLPEIPAPAVPESPVPAPATPAPAAEKSEGDDKPAAEDDPFSALPAEPVRRWFDDSGSHDTVGRLVEVHPDHVRIMKLNGRFTTVSRSRLSTADQSYVTTMGERLAAKPSVTDTAGM